MAKHVKSAARCAWKTSTQEDTERLGLETCCFRRGERSQRCRSQGSVLRAHQRATPPHARTSVPTSRWPAVAIRDCRVPLSDMRRESAQLDQCAVGRTRTALASPSPPAERDKVDRVCAAVEAFGVPRIYLRQDHVLIVPDGVGLSVFRSQCAQPEIGSRGATHKEGSKQAGDHSPKGCAGREPVAVWICSPGNARRNLHGRWEPQNLQALLDYRQ